MDILISIIGVFVLLGLGVYYQIIAKPLNSHNFGRFGDSNWFCCLILYFPAGRNALLATANCVSNIINYGNEGISFVFGNLRTYNKGIGFVLPKYCLLLSSSLR